MMQGLFRQQAIEHQQDRLYGDVILVPRLSHTLIISILLFWLFITIVWLSACTYARKETVSGWVEPPSGIVRIYPEDTGLINKIYVAEGELVVAGQRLMTISSDRILATGVPLESQMLDEYKSLQARLSEQLLRTTSIFDRKKDNLQERIIAAKLELEMVEKQLNTAQDRRALAQKQVQRHQNLMKQNYISSRELDNATEQELSLESDWQALMRSKIEQKNLIEQLKTELILLPEERANALNELTKEIGEINLQVMGVNGQRSRTISAAKDGVVTNLQAIEGQQVTPESKIPLLTLLPTDINLNVHLLVPVRAVGFVEPGQRLDVRFDAFPYQKFGLYDGEIKSVTKTLLLPNELSNSPIALNEPAYRVVATLKQSYVHAYGKDFPLKPGMTLSADVRLGDRTLMQWFLDPIYSLQGRL